MNFLILLFSRNKVNLIGKTNFKNVVGKKPSLYLNKKYQETSFIQMTGQFANFYEYYSHVARLVEIQSWEAAEQLSLLFSLRDPHADLKFLQVFTAFS